MSSSLTTLQLAEAIARAVKIAINDRPGAWDHPGRWLSGEAAQAVLKTLRVHGCWFCRVTEGPEPVSGIVKSEQMELTY